MRRTTAILNQWKAETQTEKDLHFELCKGGYFSDQEEYGLKVVGKTDQKTLTGKNLFNGVLQGGYYGDADFGVVGSENLNFVSSKIFLKKGTYTLSASVPLSYVRLIINGVYYAVGHQTFTNEADGMVGFSIRRADNTNWDYEGTIIQIEEGTAATSIEPYCCGVPSPNPDYPQEIQCVKAGTKVRVTGKNLLPYPYSDTQTTKCGITIIDNGDGSFTLNGTATDPCNLVFGGYTDIPIPTTQMITWNTEVLTGTVTGISTYVYSSLFNSENKSFLRNNNKWINKVGTVSITGTLPETTNGYNIYIQLGNEGITFNNFIVRFWIVDADISDKSYEPYISGGEVTVPCDLYEGDIWYPMTGRVERQKMIITWNGN